MDNILDYTVEDGWHIEVEIEHDEGVSVVKLEVDGNEWYEGDVLSGEEPYGWGGKTYMGYLTVADVLNWLQQDYIDATALGKTY